MERIGSNGLEETKKANIKQGHTYYMGASSSPKLVYVEDIGDTWVTYRVHPYYPENKQKERKKIFMDLVAQGTETMKGTRREKYIDRNTNLKEIQRSRIKFKVKDKAVQRMDNPARDIERKYRKKYGLETNLGEGNHTYTTTVNRENVSKIRKLPEIRVISSGKP